ncbi:hypothetical protein KC19_8G146800 [Ceratodon purpureus]|uniref:Uncharacterized protein n=1 Tax=Ceratodon purpureus TaxID=3225 RepID=A0A8T0H3F5_CERPU|nr:hypothetical protein KC19_8G146800 [Ceratodon purpureus]
MMGLQGSVGILHCGDSVLRTSLPALATRGRRSFCSPLCSMGGSNRNSNVIKVVVNGVGSELGKAAVLAIHKARGMELAGALDSKFQGQDAGEVAGLEESLEIPILNDIVMVLGSLSQGTSLGVFVDLDDPAGVYENVRQATAFGLKSVVGVPGLDIDAVGALSSFCDKASTGCIVAPSLSIGTVLLQQAAAAAAFHYNHVEIIESQQGLSEYPSQQATQLASSLSGLGQIYNDGNGSNEFLARGAVVGDGVRIHSMALPGLVSSTDVRFAGPGETLSIRHDVTDVKALMPGLILAIRRVVRLKSLVYGLEKIL